MKQLLTVRFVPGSLKHPLLFDFVVSIRFECIRPAMRAAFFRSLDAFGGDGKMAGKAFRTA
jgi:hypothetical protein